MRETTADMAARPSGAFSLPRAMWTAGLAGGVLGTGLGEGPVTRIHPYFMYAIGALVGVYVFWTLLRNNGRKMAFGQALRVSALCGLLPGVVQYVLQPWTYNKIFLPSAEAEARAVLAVPIRHGESPQVNAEQVRQMLSLYHSRSGPWLIGAETLILIVLWTAIIGLCIEMVLVAFAPKTRAAEEA